ncbi:hypothetical protein [Paraburkholderia sp. BCC1886]|uniref:hypothetical protein n=1 Tax=Paraburkholderia sp. BCC1886 TaxID=2562670 RepID=UPI0011820E49|nr:hypothetical protein [Paraburkholderia sp. BCC1886]
MKQHVKRSAPVARPKASTWLPPEQRDSAWYIFHQLFNCRVQRIATISVNEMRDFGTPTSGETEYDKQMQNERIDRMLTIAQMVKYWKEGVTIGVTNEKDTKQIYQLITDHLVAWKNRLAEELVIRNAPLDELTDLDRFANTVYSHAKYQFTEEIVESILHRKMMGGMRATRSNLIAPTVITINKGSDNAEPEEPKRPDRVSMSDAFARGREQSAFGPRWK